MGHERQPSRAASTCETLHLPSLRKTVQTSREDPDMSRRSRKRFERIHTKRAKAGFPRVSPSILHKDGTIEPAPRQGYRVVLSPTFQEQLRALSSTDQQEIMQAAEKLAENPYRGRRIIASPIERIHDWLLWLWHELRFRLRI